MTFTSRGISDFGRRGLGLAALALLLGTASAQDRTARITLVPDARSPEATEWRLTTVDPGEGWFAEGFDESAWLFGKGGFGTGAAQGGSAIGYDWTTTDIWLRKTFTAASTDYESLVLSIQHDEEAEVYLNGVPVLSESFKDGRRAEAYLSEQAKAALKTGENILAVHCRNTDGPGYIDAGLIGTRTLRATYLVTDATYGGEEWRWTDAKPGAGWNETGFADADWSTGRSGFGSTEFGSHVGSAWTNYEIWIRKTFTMEKEFSDFLLSYLHDDEMELFINGNLVLQEAGSGTDYTVQTLPAGKLGLVVGENVLAVHCANSGGGPQFIDAGLVGLEGAQPVRMARGRAAGRGPNPSFPRILFSDRNLEVNLSGFPAVKGASLDLYGLDGSLRATLRPDGGKILALPSGLGSGAFRYRWLSPSGSGQGLLIQSR
ncbi:MAG: glutaminase [Fibrobacteres bacterium]|nr:glutaminase [Fibrobacterota bacterium]